MSSEGNSSLTDTQKLSSDIAIPRIVRFWLILPFYIPSLICSLFVLYHFVFTRNLRQASQNHAIALLLLINLIVQLTCIPWVLNYYRYGYVTLTTPSFCLAWTFFDETLYITTTILFAWATIERHILIFHDQLVSTRKKLILYHVLPIVLILFYGICYNIIVVLFPPCENTYDYTQVICSDSLCNYENHFLAMWDVIFNNIIPTIIIIVFSIALLIRVVYQKYRMNQRIRWRNHRKMTIQLLSISFLYLVIYIPKLVMEFAYRCGLSEDVGAEFMKYNEFYIYYGNLFLPFICAGSIPDLKTKIKNVLPCWRRQTQVIAPQPFILTRRTACRQLNTNGLT